MKFSFLFYMFRDRNFQSALMMGPVFCAGWFWVTQPELTFQHVVYPQKLLFLVIIYPVIEEIVFRGVLQENFSQITKKTRLTNKVSDANLFTSAIFACLHLFSHSLLWSLATFIPSVIFGYFKDKYNSIIPCVVLHLFYNLSYFSLFS